ncbi:MAG: 50S ribosomal protein L35 [Proteobacteria bacterium]|nr:50S ribosomal protein L35 [Pseudomonadota bacterium]
MPKVKTNRAAAKRFTKLKSGKIKRSQAYKRHLLTSKSPARKRRLRGIAYVSPANARHMKQLLPN